MKYKKVSEIIDGISRRIIPENIKSSLTYINENFHLPIKLGEIANAANLSRIHFSKIFKKKIGCNPFDYIIALRISMASDLLSSTGHNISEICYRVGYESLSHFSSTFKKWTGFYPGEYRDKYYVNEENKSYVYDLRKIATER